MGLFKRRSETKEELETLRSELTLMRRRIDESEDAKRRLAEQLGRLDADHQRLDTHVGDVTSKVGSVESQVASVGHHVVTVAGSIGPAIEHAVQNAASASDIESIRVEIMRLGEVAARVDELDAVVTTQQHDQHELPPPPAADPQSLHALEEQLNRLAEVLAVQQTQLADVALVATDSAERTDTAIAEMRSAAADQDASADRNEPSARNEPSGQDETSDPSNDIDDETRAELGRLAEKVASMDARINQVSLELTNQLTELSGDLDRAGDTDVADLVDRINGRLDDVTGGQERLATEQARYAIQFREDLAELAERLRRPNTR